MAEIHPFPAILYRPETGADVTPFVAPPYDVIAPAARAALRERSPYNVVRLTLPEPSGDADRYQSAAELFHAWRQSGVFHTLEPPALYAWEQEFRQGDATHVRRALVARVTCEPYRPGGVMRHELTYAGPREDRLRLFRATAAQFSQIFGIFRDDQGEVAAQLNELADREPLQTARGDDGHVSRLFRLAGDETVRRLQASLRAGTITIADGHHRYETSVTYYRERGYPGSTLMTLVPDSDPGLVVMPTHRTVGLPLSEKAFRQALSGEFAVKAHPLESWPQLYREAADHPARGVILAVAPAAARVLRIEWPVGAETPAGPGRLEGRLGDVVVLHERILPRLAAAPRLDTEDFGYFHDAEAAVQAARASGRWAFLLRPTPVEALLRAAERQEVLPPKSTYFYPKFLAGFINAWLD